MNLASGIALTLITFGGIIVGAGVVAFVAARQWGRRSKMRRQAIFAVVGVVGLIIALAVAQERLRGLR